MLHSFSGLGQKILLAAVLVQAAGGAWARAAQPWATEAEAHELAYRWAEAASLWRRSAENQPETPAEATLPREEALLRLATAEGRANRNAEVIVALNEAIALRTARLGPNAPSLTRLLADLAGALTNTPQGTGAAAAAERAVAVSEAVLPQSPDDFLYALIMRSRFRNFAGARQDLERGIPLARAHLPETRVILGRLLSDLGWLAMREGKPRDALAPLEEAELINRAEPIFHPFVLNRLSMVVSALGDPVRAEACCRGYIQGLSAIVGPRHFQVGEGLDNLAALLLKQARFAEAAEAEEQARGIFTASFGPQHMLTGLSNLRLGHIFLNVGDRPRARQHYEIAAATLGSVPTPSHLDVALVWMQLARMELEDGRDGRPHAERALARLLERLGPDHFNTLGAGDVMLHVELAEGRAEAALTRAQAILAALERSFGADNPTTAGAWVALGECHAALRQWPEAEVALRGALERAAQQGLETPQAIRTAQLLATVLAASGRGDEARALARLAEERSLRVLARVFAFTTESQRLEAVERLRPYDLFAQLGATAELAAAIIRRKGLILESMIEDELLARASTDESTRALAQKLRAAAWQLEETLNPKPGARGQDYAERAAAFDELQAQLARAVAGYGQGRGAFAVQLADVLAQLPADTALVEFIRYGHGDEPAARATPHYGAMLLRAGAEPRWFPLGPAATIDAAIARLALVAQGGGEAGTLHALERLLVAPWRASLPAATRRVLIAPDGQVNFVPFAALLADDGTFLGERFDFAYLGTGRDLLRANAPADSRLIVLAAPDFGEPGEASPTSPSVALAAITRSHRNQRLAALPGALREAAWLREHGGAAGLAATTFTGAAASEENLLAAGSPRILHLATHGLFLQLPAANRERTGVFLGNPMDRTALAFRGAAATFRAWDEGRYPAPAADGVLTAREIGALDLSRTQLVVLSACDTGQGEARDGEGVLGLRRGFARAGAQNLLLTLWQVEDNFSADFMADFYATVFSGRPPAVGLATVQRHWLRKLRIERGALEAARLAGPYLLTFQGPVSADRL